MDSDRFDQLARSLARENVRSRRGVLRTAAGGLMVGLWAAVRGSERTQAQVPPALCPDWVLARYPWLCEGNEPNTSSSSNNNNDDDNDDDDKKKDENPCAGVSCDACLTCAGGACVADATQEGEVCNTEGGTCLSNGTCLTPCIASELTCPLPGACGCSGASDNRIYCSASGEETGTCGSLADCPQGEFCVGQGLGCRPACTG